MAKKATIKNKKSNNKGGWLCSGYGVFPDGSKCKGCMDCGFGKQVMTMKEIEKSISSRVITIKKGDNGDDILAKLGIVIKRKTNGKKSKK